MGCGMSQVSRGKRNTTSVVSKPGTTEVRVDSLGLDEKNVEKYLEFNSSPERPKGGFGLETLHEPSHSSGIAADVIFIHGLTGGRKSTWSMQGKESWARLFLPKSLPHCRISTFGYDADVVNLWNMASQSGVRDHARNLVLELASLRQNEPDNRAPIIFIAHSLGGLICEDALVLLWQENQSKSDSHLARLWTGHLGMMLLGVPHGGSALAKWAQRLTRLFPRPANKKLLQVLMQDSELLARIQEDCHVAINSRERNGLSKLNVQCFFEELPTREVNSKQIVSRSSAQFSPAHPPVGIYSNHADMGKFDSDNNQSYRIIVTLLSQWISDATDGDSEIQAIRTIGLSNRQHTYSFMAATDGAEQYNGDIGVSYGNTVNSYHDIMATGNSRQINGNITDSTVLANLFGGRQ